ATPPGFRARSRWPYGWWRMQRRAPARGAADVSCTLPRRPDFADLSPLKQELEQLLRDSLAKLAGTVLPAPPAADAVVLERTREAQHGDFATNVALRLAKSARRNPRELAEAIVAALPASPLLGVAEGLEASAGARLRRPAASVLDGLPPDAPAGDKEGYIDALIARARALLGADGFREVLEHSLAEMLADIRGDLAEFGVVFDHWTSERALADSGAIDHALSVLE